MRKCEKESTLAGQKISVLYTNCETKGNGSELPSFPAEAFGSLPGPKKFVSVPVRYVKHDQINGSPLGAIPSNREMLDHNRRQGSAARLFCIPLLIKPYVLQGALALAAVAFLANI